MPEQSAEGFVLAGGKSSRMGQDKALVRLGNEPLIARAIAILRNVALQVSISGAPSTLSSFAPVIEDGPQGSRGPLSGICAALVATRSKYSVFLPVDLPFIPASLIVFMLNLASATDSLVSLPIVNGFTQTFPAVIDRAILPSLQRQLAGENPGCFRSFQVAAEDFNQHLRLFHVEHLIQTGQLTHPSGIPPSLWFQNINTLDDLVRAEMLQFGRHRVI